MILRVAIIVPFPELNIIFLLPHSVYVCEYACWSYACVPFQVESILYLNVLQIMDLMVCINSFDWRKMNFPSQCWNDNHFHTYKRIRRLYLPDDIYYSLETNSFSLYLTQTHIEFQLVLDNAKWKEVWLKWVSGIRLLFKIARYKTWKGIGFIRN